MPWVVLTPATEDEEDYKLRSTLAFLLEIGGGPTGKSMPRDVSRGVFMDLLMPVWDPLRRKRGESE